jgi:periplasmic divalent cation tolerance protein
MIIVYIACKDEEQARKISTNLLKKRLIACVNIFPVKSMYWWQNKIEEANEYIIIAKTLKTHFDMISDVVKGMHSYKVPLIEQWNVDDVDKNYLDWLNKEVA